MATGCQPQQNEWKPKATYKMMIQQNYYDLYNNYTIKSRLGIPGPLAKIERKSAERDLERRNF